MFELPTRMIFGNDSILRLNEFCSEEESLLLVCGRHILKADFFESMKKNIPNMKVLSGVAPEPEIEDVKRYWKSIEDRDFSCIIAIGGGSVLDVSKVLAAKFTNRSDDFKNFLGKDNVKNKCLRVIAAPTTSGSGSEVTKYSVIKEKGIKKVVISKNIYPEIAIVDPLLTLSMSKELTAHTGLDALTHNLESYLSKRATTFSEMYATEGVRLGLKWIEKSYEDTENEEARRALSLASVYGGIAITNAPTGIVHLLSKILDSFVPVPHGLGNAIFLPYAMKYQYGEKLKRLEDALGIGNLPDYLVRLNERLGIPRLSKFTSDVNGIVKRTKENMKLLVDPTGLGVKEEDLNKMIEECL